MVNKIVLNKNIAKRRLGGNQSTTVRIPNNEGPERTYEHKRENMHTPDKKTKPTKEMDDEPTNDHVEWQKLIDEEFQDVFPDIGQSCGRRVT